MNGKGLSELSCVNESTKLSNMHNHQPRYPALELPALFQICVRVVGGSVNTIQCLIGHAVNESNCNEKFRFLLDICLVRVRLR